MFEIVVVLKIKTHFKFNNFFLEGEIITIMRYCERIRYNQKSQI